MKKTVKWIHYVPSSKVTAVVALVMLGMMLIPLLRLTLYAVPWYDDYNYGRFARTGMEVAGSGWGALQGAIDCVRTQWYAWQGTYTSVFFMTLVPVIWGEEWYFLGPVFVILLFTIASVVLAGVLLRDVLHADKASTVTLQALTAGILLMLMYTAQSGIYWYNAAVHYVGMHSFCMLFVAVLVKLLLASDIKHSIPWLILSMLLALMVGGANYVTALQGGVLLLSIGAVGIWWYGQPKHVWRLLPALAIYGIGFSKNVLAPGNGVRGRSFEGLGLSPVQSVLQSFVEAAGHAWEFTEWITLIVLLVLLPIIWRMLKNCSFSFRLPGLILAWSVCVYATGFTPSLYSMGHGGISRTLNAVKITWQLLLLLNEIYWLGWAQQRLEKKGKTLQIDNLSWLFYPFMGCIMLCIFFTSDNQVGSFTAYGAYYYVHTGEAYNFRQQYMERVALLEGEEKDIVLEPYRYKPWFLCVGDLSENPDVESNRSLASWYGKNSVAIKNTEN